MKVARWVLRGTALGDKCRLLDNDWLEIIDGEGSESDLSLLSEQPIRPVSLLCSISH
ncbi:hypothetical protein [Vibrio mediterranei]|uniref:hypothetical protein n=1 Tax=Vibrio mediterranei TaxID=689 RepID=UPI00148C7E5D|nr:hypothetical protein [Vibrio mediterranei]